MGDITITLSEGNIAEDIEHMIAKNMVSEYLQENRDTRYGIRKGVENAVRACINERKEEIIERAVERAAEAIARKGLPKLLERISGDNG